MDREVLAGPADVLASVNVPALADRAPVVSADHVPVALAAPEAQRRRRRKLRGHSAPAMLGAAVAASSIQRPKKAR